MKIKIWLILLMTMVSTHWVSALTIETSSGNLASLVSEEMRSEQSLTLVGTMDARDFVAMHDFFSSLRTLDISAVVIEELVAIDRLLGGKTFFEADALPPQAFFGMGLTSVALPQGLKKINEGAFTAVPLKKIDIPASVITIGDYSFYDCDELESITLTSEIEEIGDYVFAGCDRLATVDLSSARLDSVSEAAFANCVSLKEVKFSTATTAICDMTFMNCVALESIALPSELRRIGERAFYGCGLTYIELPTLVETVGEFAFAASPKLEKVLIKGKATQLCDGAFFYCPRLASIEAQISNVADYLFCGDESLRFESDDFVNVEEIGDYALYNNKSQKIIIGPSMSSLGDKAMAGMNRLTLIDVSALEERVPQLGESVFEWVSQPEVTLRVADGTEQAWRSSSQWNEFKIVDYSSVVKIDKEKIDIKAWFSEGVLNIQSTDVIRRVSIYASQGIHMVTLHPNQTSTECQMNELTEKIYIVVVTTDNQVATFKLIR